jgi:lipopolysaccharide biosynthesis protein
MKLESSKRRLKQIAKRANYRTVTENWNTKNAYRRSLTKLSIKRLPDTYTAVILHLYYIESWEQISKKLKTLNGIEFDLFISLPAENLSIQERIKNEYKKAYIIEVPNRGRDVLPFVSISNYIKELGYHYVLKIHSKKSPHRSDGNEWQANMLDNLLPLNKTILNDLFKILGNKETGIIGPKENYLPLGVNFAANGTHMTNLLTRLFDKKKSYEVLQTKRDKYGFFAGTMFWVRLDSLTPILQMNFRSSEFEFENGQIDSTLAHALERVFCLVPEVLGKSMYEIGPRGVKLIEYETDNYPDWSDVYIGPQN